jgi:catechol 2,3-dioxygenase-like lactoylglutathione lyase family enzyme
MFDHVIIDVRDLEVSRAFYERAFAPLGISVVMELDERTAFGGESGPAAVLAGRARHSGRERRARRGGSSRP